MATARAGEAGVVSSYQCEAGAPGNTLLQAKDVRVEVERPAEPGEPWPSRPSRSPGNDGVESARVTHCYPGARRADDLAWASHRDNGRRTGPWRDAPARRAEVATPSIAPGSGHQSR